MATGIGYISLYLPSFYTKKDLFKRENFPAPEGKKVVSNFDEDVITMAVEAGEPLVSESKGINNLILVSSHFPIELTKNSFIVARALGLKEGVNCFDLNSSGDVASSIYFALQLADEGDVLLIFSDISPGEIGTSGDVYFSDGATALLISKDSFMSINKFSTTGNFSYDFWKNSNEGDVKFSEDKFINEEVLLKGYSLLIEKIDNSIKQESLFIPWIFRRKQLGILKKHFPYLNFADTQTLTDYGCPVNSYSILSLYTLMKQGSLKKYTVILSRAGLGFSSLILQVEKKNYDDRIIVKNLPSKEIKTIGDYMKMKEKEVPSERVFSTPAITAREGKDLIGRLASSCSKCGSGHFPAVKKCRRCGGKDLIKKRIEGVGRMVTFTKDYLTPSPFPPTVMGVADFKESRFYAQLADFGKEDSISVDDEVIFTFRLLHKGGGMRNYFWKLKLKN